MARRTGLRGRAGTAGGAIVEFALVLSLIVPLLLGVFQFGYYFYIYNKLLMASRAGARWASLQSYDSSNSTPSAAFLSGVSNVVVYGDPGGGTRAIVPNLTSASVTLNVTMQSAVPEYMTVGITNYIVKTGIGNFTVQYKPKATFRYVGRNAP